LTPPWMCRRHGRTESCSDVDAAMDVPPPWTDGAARHGGERAAQRGESGVVAVSGAEGNEMLVGNSLGGFQKEV
jgi:hypothetical protein